MRRLEHSPLPFTLHGVPERVRRPDKSVISIDLRIPHPGWRGVRAKKMKYNLTLMHELETWTDRPFFLRLLPLVKVSIGVSIVDAMTVRIFFYYYDTLSFLVNGDRKNFSLLYSLKIYKVRGTLIS